MDESISFTLQGKHGVFDNKCHFLEWKQQSKWLLLGLAACLEGLCQGERCHENKLGVTLLLCVPETQSFMQLQFCAKDVPPLLPEFCGLEGLHRQSWVYCLGLAVSQAGG